MAVRATMNNLRSGKNGVFLPQHNDGKDGKAAKMGGLLFKWNYTGDNDKSFDNVEADFYESRFRAGLDYQNEKHRKAGNKKRIRNMDAYRKHQNTCPESTLFYLGDKDEHADPKILLQAVTTFLNWREEAYPNVVSLDFAVHKEDGAPHIHERHVWIAHDENGNEIENQEKALAEMGVLPPDLAKAEEAKEYREKAKEAKTKEEREEWNKKASSIERYNNAKMTYTRICREKMQEIAREHGIEILDKPRERGKQGQSQNKHITGKMEEEQKKLQKDIELKEKVLQDQQKIINDLKNEIDDIEEYKAFRSQKAKAQAEREAREAREKAEREALEKAKREAEEARKRTEQVITVGGGVPPRKTPKEDKRTERRPAGSTINESPITIPEYTQKANAY